MDNLRIELEIEECEKIFQIVESDFERICKIYTEIINITGSQATGWQGDISSSFQTKMEEFREQLKIESVRMDCAINKCRGCLQKAKEIENLVL